ncbi:hypothetical protein [Labilibacter marinus]|uniref:hypothetical protein n=1 Tax=Labilibacter marinus TaxID=1477105 RepID=UPI00094FA597|nr:hypothetical protein [Labilibacter marinus]
MITDNIIIAQIFSALLLCAFIALHIYYGYVSSQQLTEMIKYYFKQGGVEVLSVDKLSFNDQLRTGAIFTYISKYLVRYTYKPFTYGSKYYRRVEIINESGEEELVYIAVFVKQKAIVYCDEVKF